MSYADGMVYLTVHDNLYALRATDGEVLWQSPPLRYVFGGIESSIDAGVVYIEDGSAANPILTALRGDTGAVLWHILGVKTFTVVNGVVYAMLNSGAFAAYHATDGTPIWQTAVHYFDILLPNPIQVSDGIVYAIGHVDSKYANAGAIYAMRMTDGALLWHHQDYSIGWFTVSNDIVYYSSINSDILLALRSQDGNMLWQYANTVPNSTYDPPTIRDGVIIIDSSGFCFGLCGSGNNLFALDAATGKVYWRDNVNARNFVVGAAA